jgi:hypothetical protein
VAAAQKTFNRQLTAISQKKREDGASRRTLQKTRITGILRHFSEEQKAEIERAMGKVRRNEN